MVLMGLCWLGCIVTDSHTAWSMMLVGKLRLVGALGTHCRGPGLDLAPVFASGKGVTVIALDAYNWAALAHHMCTLQFTLHCQWYALLSPGSFKMACVGSTVDGCPCSASSRHSCY